MAKKKTGLKTKGSELITTKEYVQTLVDLKKQIQEAQVKSILAANKELIKLYWTIGKTIAEKQETSSWGSGIIEKLAKDLRDAFPGIGGFSRANTFRMRAFYRSYEKVAQAVRQIEDLPIFDIPWGHNVVLMQKLKINDERLWYAQKSIENGWSRTILEMQIESNLHERTGKTITNFKKTLPAPHSDMAQQSLKDPYVFDFLSLSEKYIEQDLEQGLIDHIQSFLVELGQGFAFVGRQYHLEVGSKDYYIDLLFYHIKLRCYIVIELKAREFDPRDAGQIKLKF